MHPAPGHRRKVLIIEDERALRVVCRMNLELAGFEAVEAQDGGTGLELARTERPDVVLLDVMMPGLDGWEVAARLRDDPETQDIPIVFLSARAGRADQLRAYELGAVDYVTKPFDPPELAASLARDLDAVAHGRLDELRRKRLAVLLGP